MAGSGLSSAGSHLGFFSPLFFKEGNIRKAFALTLNPPPQVTVIAGPRGGGKRIIPVWGRTALTTLFSTFGRDEARAAALAQVDGQRAQSMQP